MNEAKLEKKYDFFEYYSELLIPKENFKIPKDNEISLENINLSLESEHLENNNLTIENSTFIIKAPETNQILIILSIDKELPPKIEKNIYSITLHPIFQEISFMHEPQNESIIISTGSIKAIDKIQVFQIQIKQLLHEAIYNLLKDIKNAVKIIPINDSYVLILHISTEYYKNGGLKLWKNFKEEIYNFNKIYNFTFNFQNNKIICIDNDQAPYIFSVYAFDESYFNKKNSDILQPEFFIQISEYLHIIKEEEIESFLHFESFSNLIIFWAKVKKEEIGYLLGIIFVNFKEKKCLDCVEFEFKDKNKYFFKINKNTNEIYIFNLNEELLNIYSFKTESPNQNCDLSLDNLFITKIKFCGNIKGIDFTANNGMVILTEQNNLICYTRNEYIFQNHQKKFKEKNVQKSRSSDTENNIIHPKSYEKESHLINNLITDKPNENDLNIKKFHSEKISNKIIKKSNDKNENIQNKENINENNINKNEENNKNNLELEKELLKKKEEEEKIHQMLVKQAELIDKLRIKIKVKNTIKELANSFQNKLSKFMENILLGISKSKLEEIENQIQLNKPEKINIDKNFDINFMKHKNFIYEIRSIIPNIYNTKNKIIYYLKNEINRRKLIENKIEYNCDFSSLELINNSINIEKIEKSKNNSEIKKILYNCSLLDYKINNFSEMSSKIKNFERRINLLLLKCKNDINQINEMYKYNKIRMSKEKESELINILINPFIECYYKELKEFEQKIKNDKFEIKHENIDLSFVENKNIDINKHDFDNLENNVSNNLMDIFEKNNFYSLSNTIIKNRAINLDNEFE